MALFAARALAGNIPRRRPLDIGAPAASGVITTSIYKEYNNKKNNNNNKTKRKTTTRKFVRYLCRVGVLVSVAAPLSPLRSRARAHSRPADCAVRGYRGRAPSVGLSPRASAYAPPSRLCAGKMAQSAWGVAPAIGVSGERGATTAGSVCHRQYARRTFPLERHSYVRDSLRRISPTRSGNFADRCRRSLATARGRA